MSCRYVRPRCLGLILSIALIMQLCISPKPVGAKTADRVGMFCVDVDAVSALILRSEDRYDAVAPTETSALRSAFSRLDKTYGALSVVLYNARGQYGPSWNFAPQHELERCDDDARFALARAEARYNVVALDYLPPSPYKDFAPGPVAITAVCALKKIAAKLGRDDPLIPMYEQGLRRYYSRHHLKLPADICAAA